MANAQQESAEESGIERGGTMRATAVTASIATATPTETASDRSVAVDAPDAAAAGLFERVLVVVDEDAASRAATETALALAAAHDATVDALYVVDMVHGWDMEVEQYEAAGEAAVEEAADRGAAAGVDVERWFRYGHPHEEVLDFAAAHDADLIVLGSARRTGVDRLLHPETLPARVQRGADVPVMTVGPDEV